MLGCTLKRKPLAKDAIVGFETSATLLNQVAFINLQFRHGPTIDAHNNYSLIVQREDSNDNQQYGK